MQVFSCFVLQILLILPASVLCTEDIENLKNETTFSSSTSERNVKLSLNDHHNNSANKNKKQIENSKRKSYLGSRLNQNEINILNGLQNAITFIASVQCQKDLNDTMAGINARQAWAIAMFDSSVKTPVGIEYGNTFQFGNYDQCMSIKTNHHVKPQYCLVHVNVPGYTVREISSRKDVTNTTLIHWGICVPKSCSSSDIEQFFIATTGYDDVEVSEKYCQSEEEPNYSALDILFGCMILAFVSMVVLSSAYHLYMIYLPNLEKNSFAKNRGCFEQIVKSFSCFENLKKLAQQSNDDLGLSCVNGIKALSMLFIVGGHALLFLIGGPTQNSGFFKKESRLIQNAFLLNTPLLVDTFLLLSGFLFARILFLELNKRKGNVNFLLLYIFRYIRLTPAYLAMIGLYSTWLPKIGNGPLWNVRMGNEQERCQINWWLNILYVNNYIGSENLCMFQSWYLATDTQLFILAPLVLYPLWKWRSFGIYLLATMTSVSVIIPFIVTYVNELDPTFLMFADEVFDVSLNEYFIHTYGKTHMRATAYMFGVLAGYLVYKMQEKDWKFTKPMLCVGWISSTLCATISMFSVTMYYHTDKYQFTALENATYAAMHRLGWSFGTSWLLVACVSGNGGVFKTFLSYRALVPFSRLTYAAYLTNGLVELYMSASLRQPKFLSISTLLCDALSHITITFLAALVLCLLFESPIHGIEKIFLRRERQHASKDNSESITDSDRLSSQTSIESTSSKKGRELTRC